MRIISGKLGGRRFSPPADKWPTRPTTDISKEGLYNILQNKIDFTEINFLDLFGGTGNHCYEMLSRGAISATYVDKFPACIRFVKRTSSEFGIDEELNIIRSDVRKFIQNTSASFDVIFAGPPYGLKWLDDIPDLIFDHELLREDGLFILEHNPDHNFEQHKQFVESRNYGQTIFSFFE